MRPDNMHVRQASAADAKRIGDMLAAAYEPVMQRMPSSDAASFAGNLPGAVARYASRGVWLLAEQRTELASDRQQSAKSCPSATSALQLRDERLRCRRKCAVAARRRPASPQ